jgi:hypothetical protein
MEKSMILILALLFKTGFSAGYSLDSVYVDGVGKMVPCVRSSSIVGDTEKFESNVQIQKRDDDRYLIKFHNLYFVLNEDEVVREAKVFNAESKAVFLVWKINRKLQGSDYSRIIIFEADDSNTFTIFESLEVAKMKARDGIREFFITSILDDFSDFPVIDIVVHRDRTGEASKDDWKVVESWDLIKGISVEGN